jgi:hypothetical protein
MDADLKNACPYAHYIIQRLGIDDTAMEFKSTCPRCNAEVTDVRYRVTAPPPGHAEWVKDGVEYTNFHTGREAVPT